MWRRVAVFLIIMWSMGLITYIAVYGDDDTRKDVAFYVSGILVSTVGSYLFGATWDNQNERKANLAAAAISPDAGPASNDVTADVNVKV